jgi:hypothetical protein
MLLLMSQSWIVPLFQTRLSCCSLPCLCFFEEEGELDSMALLRERMRLFLILKIEDGRSCVKSSVMTEVRIE